MVRGMARRGGSLRRSLKHLTIGGGGGVSGSGAGDANSGRDRKSAGFSSGMEGLEENAETVEKRRRNGVSDDDNDDGKAKSTWSQRYSAWRRSLRGKAGKNAEPAPPDDAVVPKTCCAFSRR